MRIFLVGYMGAGKSTVGKRLAKKLDVPFHDLDGIIIAREGKSVPDIFTDQGEAGFRGLERKYLREIVNEGEEFVLATGGGAPCFYDNLMFMKANGLTIYLQMDIQSLVHRLMYAKDARPLIKGKSEDELKSFVTSHLESRVEYYEDCELVFPALGLSKVKLDRLLQLISSKTED